jgi:putative ATPase
MSNLFEAARRIDAAPPLAEAARPTTIADVIGQKHLIGAGMPFARLISTGRLGSVVLYGPPGIGKTTLSQIVGNMIRKDFVEHHAADLSVKQIKELTDNAMYKPTLVFIDEIHRLTSVQQDSLLKAAEMGYYDLISATSKNPYHHLSDALNSRSAVYELRPLTAEENEQVLERGVKHLASKGIKVRFGDGARLLLARKSGGDARRALLALEQTVVGRDPADVLVDVEVVNQVLDAAPVRYDRAGEAHYDIVSAFAKSMRGGDADATLYWLAALLHAGEDPRYIARRMVIHASEDVGLADNSALQTAVSAFDAIERIGMPEGRIVLAHAALHICRAPKSNSAMRGIGLALDHIKNNSIMPVPNHLRDTHYEGAAPQGRGGYKSPHATADGWLEQEYAPGIKLGQFYQSDARQSPTFEARSDSFWEAVKKRVSPRKWGRKE